MPSALRNTAGASAVAFALCAGASAHSFHTSGQETYVSIRGGKLVVEYRTTYGPVQAGVYALRADADRDGELTEQEKGAFLERLSAKLLAGIDVTVDGRPLKSPGELRYSGGTVSVPGPKHLPEIAGTFLTFEAALINFPSINPEESDELPRGPHVLRLVDGNLPGDRLGEPRYFVRAGPPTRALEVSTDGRTLEWAFDYAPESGGPGAEEAGGAPGAVAKEGEREEGSLAALVGEDELTLGFVLVALAMAAGLGALHSFSPGHGKAIVAAYLIGSRGRAKDACLLGLVVAFTHVLSVVVLGVVALVLMEHFLPEDVYPWLGAVSGSLVFVIGYWMLASRALGIGHHHHPDGRGRSEAVTPWGLFWLGISGGMVPCPLALVVLLAAVALHRVGFGLCLIGAFSLGHAAVLALIGILTVTAARFMIRFRGDSRWVAAVPVLSAGVVMLMGVSIAVNALASGGILGAGR